MLLRQELDATVTETGRKAGGSVGWKKGELWAFSAFQMARASDGARKVADLGADVYAGTVASYIHPERRACGPLELKECTAAGCETGGEAEA